eukprot:TRINITY_DN5041_c0_g1_i3.p1 TRINITY_DN5041_c0_g1~~TRINITY_DN5041_c0_g1_i3.p1  ORF type:complete len:127 (-),score=22.51 TRINITY_DN5041_c0_g1_i3:93-473(-)
MRSFTFFLLGLFVAVSVGRQGLQKNRNWDCLEDAKGRTKRACLGEGSTPEQGYYKIDNQQNVYKPNRKTQRVCSNQNNLTRPKCPKLCEDGSFCYELVCQPYSPCASAGGKWYSWMREADLFKGRM